MPSKVAGNTLLRRFSKLLCASTFFLIFLGALVKSTESGLSVPDWPTTYGHFMFSFPVDQMVGGIKYEHTHRMAASIVGLMSLSLCIWLFCSGFSLWIKRLGLIAFLMVVAQGILGGLTVKFFLPVWLSTFHGVLAQTFFLVTVLLCYATSVERHHRWNIDEETYNSKFMRFVLIFVGMVFVQLILGNLMRHTESGLAIPDFPTMAGGWWPFSQEALQRINAWRFEHNLEPVKMGQVHLHFLHRFWAFLILAKLFLINQMAYQKCLDKPLVMKTLFWLNMVVMLQIMLGIGTVLMHKEVVTTTLHVACGALVLALSFLLFLRCSPLAFNEFKEVLGKK